MDYRLLVINAGTLFFSMTNADAVLKVTLLLVTIFYTLHKWWLLHKGKDGK